MTATAEQTKIGDNGQIETEPVTAKVAPVPQERSYTVLSSTDAKTWKALDVVTAGSQAAARKAALTDDLIKAAQDGKTVMLVAVSNFEPNVLQVEQPELRIRA